MQSASTSSTLLIPTYQITYEGVDITADLELFSTSVRYDNSIEGESAELELEIIDWDKRWSGEWSPSKGDRITAQFGYEGQPLFDAGSFEVETIELRDPPRSIKVVALATPFSAALRETRNQEYEGTTLRAIAQSIADRHGLELVGDVPEVKFERQTQSDTNDLSFLQDLCDDYDLLLKVENGQLIFYSQASLEREAPILDITDSLASISLSDSLDEVYQSVVVTYQNPEDQELIESESASTADESVERRADTLYLTMRVEDKAQADLISAAKLRQANAKKLTGSMDFFAGMSVIDAGVNVTLSGYGTWNGTYQIKSCSHQISPDSGYSTRAEVRKVYEV